MLLSNFISIVQNLNISGVTVLKIFVTNPAFQYISAMIFIRYMDLYFPFSLVFTLKLTAHFLTVNYRRVQNRIKQI